MQAIEVVFTSAGTAIGLIGLATPFILRVLTKRDTEITLLKTKNDILETANHKLEMQNLELRITGVAVNELLNKLPKLMEQPEEDRPV